MTDQLNRVPGLIDENPILIYPSIAKILGINKTAIIQQLHFLLNMTKQNRNVYNFVNDRWWVYNNYKEWQDQYFPWLSQSAIKLLFRELEKDGFVHSMQSVKNKSDRKKWYSIDYVAWNQFVLSMGQKMSDQPSDKNCLMVGQNLSDGYSETTTETTESDPPQVKSDPKPEPKKRQRNAIAKSPGPIPFATETVQGRKKPYDDVDYSARWGIINAWCSNLRAQPIGAFKSEVNHETAADIHRAGYTEQQVAAFGQWAREDRFWKDKTLKLQKVAQLLPEWVERRKVNGGKEPSPLDGLRIVNGYEAAS